MSKATRTVFDIVTTVVGMSGLRLDRSALQIGATFVLIALSFFISLTLITNSEEALFYVVVVWCIYYVCHIIFYKARLHHYMHHRMGKNRAWTVYEAVLGVVYFNQGWCVVMFLQHYTSSLDLQVPHLLILLVGATTFLISTVAKVWATLLVGMDVYYYRDLFLDEAGDGGAGDDRALFHFLEPNVWGGQSFGLWGSHRSWFAGGFTGRYYFPREHLFVLRHS